jgi:hypothetical protein
MDSVLCDFDKQYIKVNGVPPSLSNRDKKERDEKWIKFISGKNFEKLDYFKGAETLLKAIDIIDSDPDVEVQILSSAGGPVNYDEVKSQKVKWLKNHNISYKVNIVKHRSKKKEYATENSVLIDDTDDVITGFKSAGGHAILHKDVTDTVGKLMQIYKDFKNKL